MDQEEIHYLNYLLLLEKPKEGSFEERIV
jgi:hypothetical protein